MKSLFRALLTLSISFLFSVGSLAVEPGQLTVRGEAQLEVQPDQVSISIGVLSEASTVKRAMNENSKKINAVVDALFAAGITEQDYKTRRFNVNPIWSSRPKNAPANWRRSIVAYTVSNELYVTSRRLEDIGELLSAAAKAGANDIGGIHFSLANPRQYRQQAIEQAVEYARQDAQVAALANGDTLGRTISIQLDNAAPPQPIVMHKSRGLLESAAAFDAAPVINSGDITISASVTITYELGQ